VVGRAPIAVAEDRWQENHLIAMPDVLQSYMGSVKPIEHDK